MFGLASSQEEEEEGGKPGGAPVWLTSHWERDRDRPGLKEYTVSPDSPEGALSKDSYNPTLMFSSMTLVGSWYTKNPLSLIHGSKEKKVH